MNDGQWHLYRDVGIGSERVEEKDLRVTNDIAYEHWIDDMKRPNNYMAKKKKKNMQKQLREYYE